MKKFMTLMLGLSLVLGSASVVLADDAAKAPKKEKKMKKAKKEKKEEKK